MTMQRPICECGNLITLGARGKYLKKCDKCRRPPGYMKARNRRRKVNTREKLQARRAVENYYKRHPEFKKPCVVCGNKNSVAHHVNGYDKANRFNVEFYCRLHHDEVHRSIRRALKEAKLAAEKQVLEMQPQNPQTDMQGL